MDAIPSRDLTPLERAIQAFNAGEDPSAGVLQRAFLDAEVSALSPTEPADGHTKLVAIDGGDGTGDGSGDGETYLEVFTHTDRVDLEVAKRYPVLITTTGDKMLALATAGITINPGSDSSLAVAVRSAGVQQMRELALHLRSGR